MKNWSEAFNEILEQINNNNDIRLAINQFVASEVLNNETNMHDSVVQLNIFNTREPDNSLMLTSRQSEKAPLRTEAIEIAYKNFVISLFLNGLKMSFEQAKVIKAEQKKDEEAKSKEEPQQGKRKTPTKKA